MHKCSSICKLDSVAAALASTGLITCTADGFYAAKLTIFTDKPFEHGGTAWCSRRQRRAAFKGSASDVEKADEGGALCGSNSFSSKK
jgi:hypothetical protein